MEIDRISVFSEDAEPIGPFENPFYHRDAIKDRDFFLGRKRETRRIMAALKGGQCVSIVGPWRIGKTSLLFNIADKETLAEHGLAPNRFVPVYCTGQELSSDGQSDLYHYLAEKIRSRLQAEASQRRLDELVGHLTWSGLTVILLLDEFELFAVNLSATEDFFHNLRALQAQHALQLVTSSRMMLRELGSRGESFLPANFFQMFFPLCLGLFGSQEALSLTRLSQRFGITFSERTIEFILDMAGFHPFFLQIACDHVFERRTVKTQLDASDYERLRQEIGSELEGHFRYYWDTLEPAQQSVLADLKDAQTDPDQAQHLKALTEQALVVRKGEGYGYVSASFGDFVQKRLAALAWNDRNRKLIGCKLGSARLVEEIGSGGMATVYKAYQSLLDRDVAVKVLTFDLYQEGFLERFRREAQAIAKLRHPNILFIYDFGQEDNLAYIIMDYGAGGTLADWIRDGLQLEMALEIAIQVADALHCAHEHGILHRDVKPSNILMDKKGRPLLADFGLAKFLMSSRRLTETGAMMGTIAYVAPEQARGQEVDARADIYSLGVVLYEMVTGSLPFDAENGITTVLKKLQELPPSPKEFKPSLPVEVEQVILKAIALLPDDRYQSALEMREALRSVIRKGTLHLGEDVSGISLSLYKRLRTTLLRCAPFAGDSELEAVFVDARISPWRYKLPKASNPISQMEATIALLHNQYNDAQENALVLLLRVLSDHIDPGDACHRELAELASELELATQRPGI